MDRNELETALGIAVTALASHRDTHRRVYDEGARLQEEVDRLEKEVKALPLEKSSKKRKG